jgi:hypothetical protein
MRFLFALFFGLFCATLFGQDPTANPQTPPRATLADASLAAKSTSEPGQAAAPAQPTPVPTSLVDAPSATQQSSCLQKNGKPCPEWLHKLIGQYPPIDVTERWNGQPDHFFTFGNARRALHPDKRSWMLFTAAQAGMWASAVIAVRNHRTSHEEAHSEYPAAAFMTGMDLLLFKTISPVLSVGPPVYAMVHYSKAATK